MTNSAGATSVPGDSKPKGPPEHLVLWLTLLAIGFVAVRILIVSRGDSDTLRALIQNLNVTAIILATILPVLATAILLLTVLVFMTGVSNYRQRKLPGKVDNGIGVILFSMIVLGPLCAAVAWFGMPMKYIFLSAVLSLILIVTINAAGKKDGIRGFAQGVAAITLVLVVAAGIWILIAQVGVWLPRERLTMGWFTTDTVYVLSSDEVWTKYLDSADQKVKIVQTTAISSRQSLSDNDGWLNRTPAEIWG